MSALPPLPMKGYYRRIPDGDFGEHEFTAEALQPAGVAVLFEFSTDLAAWEPLGWWAAYGEDQQVSVGVITRHPTGYIRATPQETVSGKVGEARQVNAAALPGQWVLTARARLRDSVSARSVLTMTELKARLAAQPLPPQPGTRNPEPGTV